MSGLGDLETDWKDKISATLLLGSDSFVPQRLKRLKGNRHEQLGLRQSERMGPDWDTICGLKRARWRARFGGELSRICSFLPFRASESESSISQRANLGRLTILLSYSAGSSGSSGSFTCSQSPSCKAKSSSAFRCPEPVPQVELSSLSSMKLLLEIL
jgi:hypothetical protein